MNHRISLLTWLASFFALAPVAVAQLSNDQKEPYRIEISVEGVTDSVAYLGYYRGDKRYVLDTTSIDNKGSMVFEGEKVIKTGVYFLYTGSYTMEFLIDRSLNFSLTTKKETTYPDMIIENAEDNEQFRAFQLIMIAHQQKMKELMSVLDSISTAADTIRVREDMAKATELNQSKRDSLLVAFGDSFMTQILVMMNKSAELKIDSPNPTLAQKKAQYNYYKDHFFDGLDFDSEGLIRTPNFYGKVKEYIDRVTFQNPDSIIASIDVVLDKAKNNPELYRYWMGVFFQEYQNPKIMGMDKVFVHLSDEYYLKGKVDWADSTLLAELKKEMTFLRENQIGMKAPQIYLVDTLDRRTTLYDIQSDYLVLYFYDPDCGHCKKKTPVLFDLYKKMEGDFDVAAVTVGTDIEKWKEFIQKFGLEGWLNLGDPHYKSNFRVQYNVRSTPQIYILDRNKEIIAKKLDVEQIEGFINDRKKMDQ
ncbi:thioredoxin-like domain-containing protein [Reichenbachiella carrageenanivorans]|uniref:Thioredoxin-like domain-containing protein n=1 Tax=Reichenbachiella carrageenanivorans TaxID=2979869 RepID=A0ABY6CXA5_9BACT|nr:thioredoxin-like domain-containing protein [Reichenbachiella carrageenanivorans]UXX78554.1 thioredoxin-like domain-containing protein [Reichenbachiella carrageenanivorans]